MKVVILSEKQNKVYYVLAFIFVYGHVCFIEFFHCFVHEVVNVVTITMHWKILTIAYMLQLKTTKGLALQDILTEVHAYIHRGKYTHTHVFLGLCFVS